MSCQSTACLVAFATCLPLTAIASPWSPDSPGVDDQAVDDADGDDQPNTTWRYTYECTD